MPRQMYFPKAGLKHRGWTESLIWRVLGGCDEEATNPYYESAEPMKLYLRDRVEEAERQVPEVQQAIQKAGPRYEESCRLVAERDRKFGKRLWCQTRKRGFSVTAAFDGTGRVKVMLTGGAGDAEVILSDPEIVQLVESACEQRVADAVLKWLAEHGAGDEEFRTVLNNCLTGQAPRLYKVRRAEEQRRREEEWQRRLQAEKERQQRAFQHEHRVGEFVLTFVHTGEGPLVINVYCDSGGSTGACMSDPACTDLARACTTPEAVPQFLTALLERGIGNERFRLAADCIIRGDAQAWREQNERLRQVLRERRA